MRVRVYDHRILHKERGPPGNPEAGVLRRNNCGTRASSRALLPFNGGIRRAYTVQSLSSIYGQVWPESLCGVRLDTGSLERIADGLKEEAEEAVSPVWPLLSI